MSRGFVFSLFISNILSELYKLIFLCSDTDLFGVVNAGLPVCHGMGVRKVVVVALILVGKHTVRHYRLGVYGIGSGHIKGNGVK